jgi:excinuclease ABC subunit C
MNFDLKNFPQYSGVYIMKNENGEVLYVGKAKNLRKRLQQYFTNTDTRASIAILMPQVKDIETIVVNNEKEALLLENNLIKNHHPKYNILLKDDKTFIAILITNHFWPRIKTIRNKNKKEGLYFGPYTDSEAAKKTLELILKFFPIRQCSDNDFATRKRPCILYDMKKCIAPCVNKCSHAEYMENVHQAILLLEGHNKEIIKVLKKKMTIASDDLDFEKAQKYLKLIKQLEHIAEEQNVENINASSLDVYGYFQKDDLLVIVILFYRENKLIGHKDFSFSLNFATAEEAFNSFLLQYYANRDNTTLPKEILLPFSGYTHLHEILKIKITHPQKGKKLKLLELANKNANVIYEKQKEIKIKNKGKLLALQNCLKLTNYPKSIYCFDNSSFGGKDFVSAAVCFYDGEKSTKEYRLFKIKGEKKDEFSSLKEVLLRFFKRDPVCDLLLIDGGRAQLNTALNILKEQNINDIDVIAICKEDSRHDKGLTNEKLFSPIFTGPLILDKKDEVLLFLQKIRDEAHRFAISFHRKKQKERLFASELDTLRGIGPKKRRALLRVFKSIDNIKRASTEELKKVNGITESDIIRLKELK